LDNKGFSRLCVSSCLCLRKEQLLPLDGLMWTFILEYFFSKISCENSNSDKNNGYFTCRTVHICDHTALISSNRKHFRQKSWRKSKHTFVFNDFSPEVVPLMRHRGKMLKIRTTNDNMSHCMLIPRATDTQSEYVMLIAFPE
jgi:hypothetical protein